MTEPLPLRVLLWRWFVRRLPRVVSFETRVESQAVPYLGYAYCMLRAAEVAKKLGISRVSVLELGVAGGSGLLAIESHARAIEEEVGVTFEIYGFDSLTGMPEPSDYRDFPSWIHPARFASDEAQLRARGLTRAKLVIGDVAETVGTFFETHSPAPVACVLCDLVLYSSTAAALRLFEGGSEHFLPRVFCCFDDTIGSERELYSDYTGERLAIREFNDAHAHQKIARNYYLIARRPEVWHWKVYVYHDFAHPRYNDYVG
jgi:hypothetical protein